MILKNKRKNYYRIASIFTIIVLFFLIPASAIPNLNKNSNGSDKLNDHNYWVVIDPIKEYFVGDLVNISGTTNAPPSSNLTILVAGSCFMNPAGFPCPRIFELYTITEFNISSRNTSFFLVQVNTSGYEPDVYEVFVNPFDFEFKGNPSVVTLKQKYWFVIDPLKEYSIGDLVNISGTTNAPPGSNLTVSGTGCVMNPPGFPCPWFFEPVYTITQFNASTQNASFFSVQLNTSGHEPDIYNIYVFGLGSKGSFSELKLERIVSPIINIQTQSKPSQSASQPAPTNPYLIIFSLSIVLILYLNKN